MKKSQNLKKMRLEYQRKKIKLETKQEQSLQKANEQAREIVRRAKKESNQLLKEIREFKEQGSEMLQGDIDRKLTRFGDRVKKTMKDTSSKLDKEKGNVTKDQLEVGTEVKLLDVNQKGTVLKEPDDDDKVLCQVGIMKIKTPITNLQLTKQSSNISYPKSTTTTKGNPLLTK